MARILLVDDDPNVYALLDKFLGGLGHDIMWAADGAFGVSTTMMEHPDLIIMDMRMPGMDGRRAIDILKMEPGMAGIPVVVLSGVDEPSVRQDMLDAGAVAYLVKPVDLKELQSCIEGTLTFRSKPNG